MTGDINTYIGADHGATVTVGGNVKEGITARNDSKVSVDGSVDANIDAIDGSYVSVNKDITGDILLEEGKVSANGNVTGKIDSWGGNLDIQGNLNGGLDQIDGTSNITGSIFSKIDTKYGGYAASACDGSITVAGNVSLDNKKGGQAVSVEGNTDLVSIVVGGNVSAKSTDTTLSRTDRDDPNYIITKDVVSTGVDIFSDCNTDVTVKGNVDVSSNAFSTGIYILKEDNGTYDEENDKFIIKDATINVSTGSINVNAPKEFTTVKGKHTTTNATAIEIESGSKSQINVVVKGDAISSGDRAISIYNGGAEGNSKTNIVVDGTIKSSKNQIVITNVDEKNSTVDITAWKIDGDTANNVLVRKENREGDLEVDEEASKKQAENINYIIRHEGTVTLDETRLVTVNGNTFETAHEQEKLTIHVKVDDEKKYRVDRVEGGTATATKNADGSWTLIVPKNGGVDIRAVLVAIEQTKHNSGSSGGGSSSSRPGVNNASTGMMTTTPEGATVQTNVTKNDNSSVTTASVRIGTATADVTSSVSDQNGTKVTLQNAAGSLAGASFKGVGQISADGATLVKEDGTTAKMATGMLLAIENADGTSVGCFVDEMGKTIATGAFEVYYMLGTDGKLHAHFVNPQGYFLTGIQVINGQTVTFSAAGEMVSVL